MLTVKQLRKLLSDLPATADDHEIKVWLPGSRIYLQPSFVAHDKMILIEGNLEPGSALE